jgi:hypothetical protein
MAYCPQCGTAVSEDLAKFCPSCGATLPALTETAVQQKIKKSKLPFVILSAVLLLIIAVVTCKFIFNSRSAYAAVLAPLETDAFYAINPTPSQAKNAENISEAFLAEPEVKSAWEDLQKDLFYDENLSFEEDVKPWLGGEVSYYITDIGMDENYTFVFATRDKSKSDEFMEKICDGKRYDKKTYKGIDIITVQDNYAYDMLFYAYIKNYLVISSSDELIQQAIDNSQNKGRNSISEEENYKKVLPKLPKNRFGYAYLKSDALISDYIKDYFNYTSTDLPHEVGISLSFEKERIRMDYVTSSGSGRAEKTGNIAGSLGMTPGDAIAYFGSADMRKDFEELADALEEAWQLGYYGPLFYDMSLYIRELASLMSGEIAIVFLHDSIALNSELHDCGVYIIGVNDIEAVKGKIQEITYCFDGDYADTIEGYEVFSVYEYGEEVFCYGFRDDYMVIAPSTATFCSVVETKSDPLSESRAFKKATTNNYPSDMYSCLYLDVARMVDLIRDSSEVGREFREFYPIIKPIKDVRLSVKTTKDADMGTFFINMN